jgi:palmitoyltransferase
MIVISKNILNCRVRKTDVSNFLYCEICRSYVQKSSRHCRACARCVENFDHHCVWINNCIGGKNYRLFLAMINTTFLSMVIWVISASLLWS